MATRVYPKGSIWKVLQLGRLWPGTQKDKWSLAPLSVMLGKSFITSTPGPQWPVSRCPRCQWR